MGDGLGEASFLRAGLFALDASIDMLDAVDAPGAGVESVGMDAVAGEEDDVAGPGQGTQGVERNEVDAGSVRRKELEAVSAVDVGFAGASELLTGAQSLIPGGCGDGQRNEERQDIGEVAEGRDLDPHGDLRPRGAHGAWLLCIRVGGRRASDAASVYTE